MRLKMDGNAHLRARTKYPRTGEWKLRFRF